MQLHYYVPNDLCFGTYFQDAFACSECGRSELIILNRHSQQYFWSKSRFRVHVLDHDSSKHEHLDRCDSSVDVHYQYGLVYFIPSIFKYKIE